MKTYPIIEPREEGDSPSVDFAVVRASIDALQVGQAFLIPASDLSDGDGRWLSSTLGSRCHGYARTIDVQIRTTKVKTEPQGLQIKRIA